MRSCIAHLRAVPIAFDLGGHHCEWLGWGFNPDNCRDRGRHSHSFFEACYAYRGRGTFELADELHQVKRGQLFVSRPGQVHLIDTQLDDPMGIYFWYFTLSQAAKGKADASGSAGLLDAFVGGRPVVNESPPALTGVLAMILEEAGQAQPGYPEAIQWLSQKLLLETARAVADYVQEPPRPQLPPWGPSDALVREAQRFLRDNFHRPIGVQDVAAQVHVSPRHLTRLFRQQTGQPPLQHLTAMRMQAAQTLLLRHREQTVKQIAVMCGYSDARHFNEVFRKHVRLTPTAYRKSHGVHFTRR